MPLFNPLPTDLAKTDVANTFTVAGQTINGVNATDPPLLSLHAPSGGMTSNALMMLEQDGTNTALMTFKSDQGFVPWNVTIDHASSGQLSFQRPGNNGSFFFISNSDNSGPAGMIFNTGGERANLSTDLSEASLHINAQHNASVYIEDGTTNPRTGSVQDGGVGIGISNYIPLIGKLTVRGSANSSPVLYLESSASQSAPICQLARDSSNTSNRPLADIDGSWVVSTDATRTARLTLRAYDYNASREAIRIEATGSAAALGFFGTTAAIQQTGGANTAGATYTSNEQGMINTMYAALRTYGLLT